MKSSYTILSLLLVSIIASMAVPASAPPITLSAWASVAPTIDGVISPGEWNDADSIAFTTVSGPWGPGGQTGTLYVKNDASNLYLAVAVDDADFNTGSPPDAVEFNIDNDNDGLLEVGDDSFWLVASGVTKDLFWDGSFWTVDLSQDLSGAAGTLGAGVNYFEFSKPLNSGDISHDFALSTGDTIGFLMRIRTTSTNEGCWPTSAISDPSGWNDIVIAGPQIGVPEFGLELPLLISVALVPLLVLYHRKNLTYK